MKKQMMRLGMMGVVLVISSILFYSCKKNTSDYVTPGPQFSNTEMTTASFTGQIVKEDGTPLDGATVTTGSHMFTTDADGFFYFSDISTPLNATLIKVEKAGYFEAFKTIQVIANEDNQTRIMIMELPSPVSLSASAGGTVTIANGGSIVFPANAIVDESTGQAYTGNVSVYAKWIDPSSDDLASLTPGDLRGITDDGEEEGLTTYGMQAVELVGSAGESLQLAAGQTAEVTFPLPATLSGAAPNTVPLWHFDEVQGMWVEEGQATKVGTDYVGSVSHFSFWNCDYGGEIVNFTCQIVDASNNPIVGGLIRLVPTSLALTPRTSTSNSSGTILGGLPINATFDMYYIPPGCGWNSPGTFIQSFSSTTVNLNLGTITVTSSTGNPAVVSGVVQDCSSAILPNAPVKLTAGNVVLTTTSDAAGTFSFALNCLSGSTPVTITAYDPVNLVNGGTTLNVSPSTNTNVGNIQACGTLNGFITWSSNDGTTITNGSLVETVNNAYFSQSYQLNTYISGSDSTMVGSQWINFSFDGPQSVAGTHTLITHMDHLDNYTIQNVSGTPTVTLTNYQAIGGWIEGSYTATITSPINPTRTVICNFRVKRQM